MMRVREGESLQVDAAYLYVRTWPGSSVARFEEQPYGHTPYSNALYTPPASSWHLTSAFYPH